LFPNHVKIGPTDGAGRQLHDCVVWIANRWFLNIVKTDVADIMKHYSFHTSSFQKCATWTAKNENGVAERRRFLQCAVFA